MFTAIFCHLVILIVLIVLIEEKGARKFFSFHLQFSPLKFERKIGLRKEYKSD